jgi:hypothetical protein
LLKNALETKSELQRTTLRISACSAKFKTSQILAGSLKLPAKIIVAKMLRLAVNLVFYFPGSRSI